MTEAQIEMRYEHYMDTLDNLFMQGSIDQETYDKEVFHLNIWLDVQYKKSQ